MRNYVYLLKAGQYYKIGITSATIEERIRQLQTGNPYKITYVAYGDVKSQKKAQEIENYLHLDYKRHRLQGEWFSIPHSEINNVTIKIKSFTTRGVFEDYKKLKKEADNAYYPKKHRNNIEEKKAKQRKFNRLAKELLLGTLLKHT